MSGNGHGMNTKYEDIRILYFLIALFVFYKWFKYCMKDCSQGPVIISRIHPNPDESNSQCIVPLYTVSNYLENLNSGANNGLIGPPHQSFSASQISRINNSTPQAMTVPLNSGLNDMTEDSPPSYDQCMAGCYPKAHSSNLPEN